MEWAEVPRASRWLEEAGGSHGDGYQCTWEPTYDGSHDWEGSPPSYNIPSRVNTASWIQLYPGPMSPLVVAELRSALFHSEHILEDH